MADVVKAQGRARVLRWAKLGLELALSITAAVALAASGTVGGRIGIFGAEPKASSVLIVAGAILLGIEGMLIARRRLATRQLEAEEPELRRRADLGAAVPLRLMRLELKGLSEKAGFFSNERISVYREEGDGFTLVARFSLRPSFHRSLGRFSLPLEDGVLGKAWAQGSAEISNLPTPGADETPNLQWLRAQERSCGISQGDAAGFAMRSQSYVAFRIATPDQEAQGAIVFESTASIADFGDLVPKPWLTVEQLAEPAKEASERLAQLLFDSRSLSREEIRLLLGSQQVPGGATSQAGGASD
jgi:hypothetical protein